jgi:membrane associated rhomboid family serine protease
MLFIPIGRENAVIQRYAWVTYALIALNFAAFFVFCIGTSSEEDFALIRTWRETAVFLRDRPYLRVPPQAADLMPRDLQRRTRVADPSIADWRAAKEQDQLDEMAAELRQRYDSAADIRLAYVPAVGAIPTLFTSMFLHAGLLHLLGNMLFLFITAPLIEDAFGRVLFFLLYVSGGVVATLAFAWRYPDSITPLVGASGAISAVMGSYLLRYALTRIRFLFVPIIFLPFWNFTFSLPALVVLPLWFLDQLVSIPAEGDSGVAVTAHVAGFAYGLLFAGVMGSFRPKERSTGAGTKKQAAVYVDPRLAHGMTAFRDGDLELAANEVNGLLAEQPDNMKALRLALDIASRRGDSQRLDTVAARLLERSAAANQKDAAMQLMVELKSRPDVRQFLARAAAVSERWGERGEAVDLLERLAAIESGEPDAIPTLVRLATIRHSLGDVSGALEALTRALAQPNCSPEWRRRIDNTRTQWERAPAGAR